MKHFLTLFAFVFCNFNFHCITHAQTAKLYTKAGVLKSTYTKVADAIYASVNGDSIILSSHTFKETAVANFVIGRFIVLQGTISGKDTTTVDGQGTGNFAMIFQGTIRDVILTGSSGGCIQQMSGRLTGNTTIRNNIGVYTIGFYEGTIDGNARIINNTVDPGFAPIEFSNPYPTSNVIIKDNVIIAGNKGGIAGAIRATGVSSADTNFIKNYYKFTIEGNVRIENNEGSKSGAILCATGRYLNISGATIINNRVTSPGWGAAISADSFYGLSTKPYDSVGVPNIRILNSRIYNPTSTGARQTEIMLYQRKYSLTARKPVVFHSEACWWGESDTTGLIVKEAGTIFSMPNWSVTNWFCLPKPGSKSVVLSQMKLNTGAALPPSSLQSIEGKFTTTAGTFSAATSPINASNIVASDLTYPTTGTFVVTASIDADTFKPSLKMLGIAEVGFEQVKNLS